MSQPTHPRDTAKRLLPVLLCLVAAACTPADQAVPDPEKPPMPKVSEERNPRR